MLRWVILFRKTPLALRVATQPHTELRVHVGRQAVPMSVSSTIAEFVLLFFGVAAAGALALTAMGVEPITAVSASAASITNVGPALAQVGPAANYAFLPSGAKLLLSVFMIAGRLEIVTVAVLLFGPPSPAPGARPVRVVLERPATAGRAVSVALSSAPPKRGPEGNLPAGSVHEPPFREVVHEIGVVGQEQASRVEPCRRQHIRIIGRRSSGPLRKSGVPCRLLRNAPAEAARAAVSRPSYNPPHHA